MAKNDNTLNIANKVRVQVEGDWANFNALMKYLGGGAFSRGIKRDLAKGQRDFVIKYKNRLVLALVSGGSSNKRPFAPHRGGYRSPTGSVGIRSGNYLRALRNLRIKQQGYQISVSYSKGDLLTKSSPGRLRLGLYAVLFEKGNSKSGQAARPLWNQTYQAMGGNAALLKTMKGAVGMRLRTFKVKIAT